MISQSYESLGFQQLSSLSSAAKLTVPADANFALIRVETANVRWRDDGTAPTTTVGMPLNSTDTFMLEYSGNLSAIQFIAVSGSPVVDVAYYKAVG